jgi:hypothetical protein
MSTGKQLSFKYGEVDPVHHFKSNEVSYSQGLGVLTNMYVKRSGGVSNRPGFEFIKLADTQLNIPRRGGLAGVKGFVYWNPLTEEWSTIEYGNYVDEENIDYGFSIDGDTPQYPYASYNNTTPPDRLRFTPTKDSVFITPHLENDDPDEYETNFKINNQDGGLTTVGITAFSLDPGTTITYGYNGLAPFLPVSYLLMAELENGEEVVVYNIESGAITNPTTAPATIVHPHSELQSWIKFVLPAALEGVKNFALYRAAGRGGLSASIYKLAGRLRYNGDTTLEFHDYGADDPSQTPPIDFLRYAVDGSSNLKGAMNACYYQQRLVCAMKPGSGLDGNKIPKNFKAGDLLLSKLGAPDQQVPSIIFNNTGAFQCSIPITDGTPVVGQLAMQRLIAGTHKGVWVMRGGEQGILTPAEVNPLQVSNEGFSELIEPVMCGDRGYYINNSHKKLMAIIFGNDGNLQIKDASEFSAHFFNQEVTQIVALNDGENTVYVLRKDGKLIRITAIGEGQESSHGFALIETEGYIESIYLGKALRPYRRNVIDDETDRYYDVLMAYVIRKGKRLLERLNVRDDSYREAEYFADCYTPFGHRLSEYGGFGYKRVQAGEAVPPWLGVDHINIGDPSTSNWSEGATIFIHLKEVGAIPSDVIHFFYREYNEETELWVEKVIRFTLDPDAPSGEASELSGYDWKYQGTFSADVPAILQDAESNLEDTEDEASKENALTRWLPAYITLPAYGGELDGVHYALFDVFEDTEEGSAEVSVFADGEVLSSPNNPNAGEVLSVERDIDGNLTLTLPDYKCWGYVGIPYTSRMDTLDIEAGDQRTLTDANKLVNEVGFAVQSTRGGFVGLPDKDLEDMEEIMDRTDQNAFNQTANKDGYQSYPIPSEWNRAGRISIKNVDPVPMTILSVYPKGTASGG